MFAKDLDYKHLGSKTIREITLELAVSKQSTLKHDLHVQQTRGAVALQTVVGGNPVIECTSFKTNKPTCGMCKSGH